VCDAPWVEWIVAPRGATSKEILVRVPVEKLLGGVSTTEIAFRTTSDVRPTGAIHVRIDARPALLVRPPSVFLVGTEPRRVSVFDPENKPVELVEAKSSSPLVALRVQNANEIEIQNNTGQAIQERVFVRVLDSLGRTVTIGVSAF